MPRSSEGGVYPRPASNEQDTKQMPRSSEGGDKPHPYIGCVLHCSTLPRVGAGFIPALPTTDKIQSKCTVAARVGINPTPTVDVCCKCLRIKGLHYDS